MSISKKQKKEVINSKEVFYNKALNILLTHKKSPIKKYDVKVVFKDHCTIWGDASCDVYDPKKQKIVMNNKHSNYLKLCYLLHEVGHVLLTNGIYGTTWAYAHHFPYSWNLDYCKSKRSRIDNIREEVLAWEFGWEVAKELNIAYAFLSYSDYHKETQKNLKTYLMGM